DRGGWCGSGPSGGRRRQAAAGQARKATGFLIPSVGNSGRLCRRLVAAAPLPARCRAKGGPFEDAEGRGAKCAARAGKSRACLTHPRLPITVGRSSGPAFLDSLVVADDFLDDEIKEFFREIRV